jgi:hypothetical protein
LLFGTEESEFRPGNPPQTFPDPAGTLVTYLALIFLSGLTWRTMVDVQCSSLTVLFHHDNCY